MDPKNMTLGELVCEFVEARAEWQHSEIGDNWDWVNSLRTELAARLNLLELNISQNKLKWGIPGEMRNAIKEKADYQKNLKEKIKEDKLT